VTQLISRTAQSFGPGDLFRIGAHWLCAPHTRSDTRNWVNRWRGATSPNFRKTFSGNSWDRFRGTPLFQVMCPFNPYCRRSFRTDRQHGGQRLQESHLLQLPRAASTPTTSSSPFRPAWGSSDSINRTLSCEIRPSRGCASSIEISPVLNGMGPLELVYCMMYLDAHTSSQKTQPGRN
jgi:hypothetical protein